MKCHVLLLLLLSAPAWACNGLQVTEAWIREAPPGVAMMAGYAEIANPGSNTQTLCHFDSPDFGEIELHKTSIHNGVSHMQMLSDLEIPAGGKTRFEPGGQHLMLMQPKRALKAGDRVAINFHCGAENPLSVVFTVKSTP